MRHPIDTRLKKWRQANVRRRAGWSGCLHRHPPYNQLFAKLVSRVNESNEHDNVDSNDVDSNDDVFEDEESCETSVTRRSDSCVMYRRLLSLISLSKIWNFFIRYIWTSHRDQTEAQTVTASPSKVVEIGDATATDHDWNMLDSDSDREDLFQDCEYDKTNDMEDVNLCFSPPAQGFVEALNRPFSSLFLRHEVTFTPQPATPLVFTPATIATGSSSQSNTSNQARLADLCWDNYELATMHVDGDNVAGRERWSVLPRSQRMPMASCLKLLWNLDSPSYDQLGCSSITEDVEEDVSGTTSVPARCSPQDAVLASEWLPNNQQDESLEGFVQVLEDKSSGTSSLPNDCNNNVLN